VHFEPAAPPITGMSFSGRDGICILMKAEVMDILLQRLKSSFS
jgi:hypothetical protein